MKNGFHEKRVVGLVMTVIGGAIDAYTYLHYGIFASAQTGNVILAIANAYKGEWVDVGQKLLSTLFFILGIVAAKFMIHYFRKKEVRAWRLYILYYEAIIFFLVSLPTINDHRLVATLFITFTTAIQWVTFDKINGLAYTNVFTTGNLKNLASSLADYLMLKKKEDWTKFIHYFLVVMSFVIGAVLSVLMYQLLHAKAILLVATLFVFLSISQTYAVWNFIHGKRKSF